MLVKEALIFFLDGKSEEDVLTKEIHSNLSAPFYGNLGRCFYFLKEYDKALKCYPKSFNLCYTEEHSDKYINRGYISYWIAQALQKKGDNRAAFFFFMNCLKYWMRYSPHRAVLVEDELRLLKREIPEMVQVL